MGFLGFEGHGGGGALHFLHVFLFLKGVVGGRMVGGRMVGGGMMGEAGGLLVDGLVG